MDKSTARCTLYRWCVPALRPGSERLLNTEACQDRRIVPTKSTEEIRVDAPAVSRRTIGNRLLAAGLRSRVTLARLTHTPRHHQGTTKHGLVSVTFRSAFAHDTQAPPQASWCGGISYNSRSHLVFLQDKVNIARYIAQVVNPMLLPFLRQKGDVHFQQDNASPHTAAAMQRALRGVK